MARLSRITQLEVRRGITVHIAYYAFALPAAMLLPLVPAALLRSELGARSAWRSGSRCGSRVGWRFGGVAS